MTDPRSAPTHRARTPVDQAVDPVCGMVIDPLAIGIDAAYNGSMYYFCSDECRQEFVANPGDFTRSADDERALWNSEGEAGVEREEDETPLWHDREPGDDA